MLTEETKYRVFLHLLTDDLIYVKDEDFEHMIRELLHSRQKQKNNTKKYH